MKTKLSRSPFPSGQGSNPSQSPTYSIYVLPINPCTPFTHKISRRSLLIAGSYIIGKSQKFLSLTAKPGTRIPTSLKVWTAHMHLLIFFSLTCLLNVEILMYINLRSPALGLILNFSRKLSSLLKPRPRETKNSSLPVEGLYFSIRRLKFLVNPWPSAQILPRK